MNDRPLLPSEVTDHVGLFDRFAGWTSDVASRAPFFAFCLMLVAAWLVEGVFKIATGGVAAFQASDYQLQINTSTTILTFLLVALLQNSQTRNDEATQHKLNALAQGLMNLMQHHVDCNDADLAEDIVELRRAVGLERFESTT